MTYDNALVASKLRRWETYLKNFRLPDWEEIPDLGLYMEQVTVLLQRYLDYFPPELKEEQFITASTINNYVRTRVMPEPVKRRYYRVHIAYLIVILTLKRSLSIALIHKLMPMGLDEDQVAQIYTAYAACHRMTAEYFIEQIRLLAGPILEHDAVDGPTAEDPEALIVACAVLSGFMRLLAEKLLLLDGRELGPDGAGMEEQSAKPEEQNR